MARSEFTVRACGGQKRRFCHGLSHCHNFKRQFHDLPMAVSFRNFVGVCAVYLSTSRKRKRNLQKNRPTNWKMVLLETRKKKKTETTGMFLLAPPHLILLLQLIEMPVFFEVGLCLYRGNGCAAREPAGFVQSALTRRIFLSYGMWLRPIIREKSNENLSGK